MPSFRLFLACSFLAAALYSDYSSSISAELASPPTTPESSVEAYVGGPELPGGGRISCDLPAELHRRNIGSPPPNGPGCCVFTSIHHAALWQNVPALQEFPKYLVDNHIVGGGDPQKVARLIPQAAKSKGLPTPAYLQVEDKDLEILKAASRTGRMSSVTYGVSPSGRYNRQVIAHMVSLVNADDKEFVVLDNNYIGANNYEHLTPAEFLRAYTTTPGPRGRPQSSTGWAVILLNGPPPPPPVH